MAPIISKSEQKKLIESLQSDKFSNECYMVSKDWWDRWRAYVNEEGEHPGEISNIDLITSKSWSEPLNWLDISLRESIQENKDFILVNTSVWEALILWYGGGPKIDIFVVGNEKDDRCINGKPDLNPIKLHLVITDEKAGGNFCCLVSIWMSTRQFIEFLQRKFSLKEHTDIGFKHADKSTSLIKSEVSLAEIGVSVDTTIRIKGEACVYKDGGTGGQYEVDGDEESQKVILASIQETRGNKDMVDGIRPLEYAKYNKLNKYLEELKASPEKVGEDFEIAKKLVNTSMKQEKISIKKKELEDTLNSLLKIEEHITDIIKPKE